MKNKTYPTDKQMDYILNLVSSIDVYIELIEKPQQKPQDFILRDIPVKEEFYEKIITNQDVQKLIRVLTSVYLETQFLYRSSRDRKIIDFKHILTVEKFIKRQSDNLHTFKDDYIMLCKYFDLMEYNTLEVRILNNLRDK